MDTWSPKRKTIYIYWRKNTVCLEEKGNDHQDKCDSLTHSWWAPAWSIDRLSQRSAPCASVYTLSWREMIPAHVVESLSCLQIHDFPLLSLSDHSSPSSFSYFCICGKISKHKERVWRRVPSGWVTLPSPSFTLNSVENWETVLVSLALHPE